jgi:hypothetical protein
MINIVKAMLSGAIWLADTIRWSSALGWLCKDLNSMIGSAG